MGKVVVPKMKCFLGAVDCGGAGIIYSCSVSFLILGENFVYGNGDQFTSSVNETESQRRYFSVRIGTGNHLYWNINAQNTFHGRGVSFPKIMCIKMAV